MYVKTSTCKCVSYRYVICNKEKSVKRLISPKLPTKLSYFKCKRVKYLGIFLSLSSLKIKVFFGRPIANRTLVQSYAMLFLSENIINTIFEF